MIALAQRNIKLYFRNHTGVVMSLIGALISFFIYIFFLQENLSSSWNSVKHITPMLDAWMIGGTLAITGITTAFAVMGQLVSDRTNDVSWDFRMTSMSPLQISSSYFLSTAFFSFIMQVVVFAVMAVYFNVQDKLAFNADMVLSLFVVTVVNTIFATIFSQIIIEFIHTHTIYSRIATLIGTLMGFLVATYMPMGLLSAGAQRFIKLFPGAYIAASYREILMHHYVVSDIPHAMRDEFTKFLGVKISINDHLLTISNNVWLVLAVSLVGFIAYVIINRLKYNQD